MDMPVVENILGTFGAVRPALCNLESMPIDAFRCAGLSK